MFWIWHCPLVTQYKYPTATWGNMLLQWQVRIWSWGYKIKKLSVYSPPKACAPQLQVHIFLVLTSKQMKRSLDLVAFRNWCLAKLIVEQVNSRNSTFISSSNVSSRKAYLVLSHRSNILDLTKGLVLFHSLYCDLAIIFTTTIITWI
jgi:hypothetical protein